MTPEEAIADLDRYIADSLRESLDVQLADYRRQARLLELVHEATRDAMIALARITEGVE